MPKWELERRESIRIETRSEDWERKPKTADFYNGARTFPGLKGQQPGDSGFSVSMVG
jgi:hypothetical protein